MSLDRLARARAVLETICDPELPVLTISDLGVLREVRDGGERVEITITPTYSGCPALETMRSNIEAAMAAAHIPCRIDIALTPAWTTAWMSDAAREKLRAYGIAPPMEGDSALALFGRKPVPCPRCGASETELLAAFGATSCKAMWRCTACREPFEHFKCH